MVSYQEFVEYYKTNGKCLNQISIPKQKLNDKQLKSKYEKYQSQNLKQREKQGKIDEEWKQVSLFVRERDKGECQLLKVIDTLVGKGTAKVIRKHAFGFDKIIDVAHIYPRSGYPELKYDAENCVCLNRFSHTHIDLYKDPLEGKLDISFEERLLYFSFMVGEEVIERLQEKIGK